MKKPRTLTISIVVTPDGQSSELSDVDVCFNVKSVLPATEIRRSMKALKKRNGFAFDADTDSIDHSPAQRRLDGIDDADGDEE